MVYRMIFNQTAYFGRGAIKEIPAVAKQHGFTKAFIVTDPVSGATSQLGRIIFGAGVGVLVYIIRTWGGYPDGMAFAVLLMNLTAPTIDYYSRPRTYGHRKAERGFKIGE